jgi:bis(5'-nucleosyl)-tetraphosphatase (symmetrical)
MATYIIGDVHGCYRTLMELLGKVGWRPGEDRLVFTGDLINGPNSLKVLRWACENEVETVLGNHDIHFLAVLAGVRRVRKKDRFYDLLQAEDREELAEWLRTRPFLVRLNSDAVVVHAGLLPCWDMSAAERVAAELAAAMRGRFPEDLFRDTPDYWSEDLPSADRVRVGVNAMTRMRALTADGRLDLSCKSPPEAMPKKLVPWFAAPDRAWRGTKVFFGHWASLGHRIAEGAVALDSGCVWGNKLTTFRLEDQAVFQVASEKR